VTQPRLRGAVAWPADVAARYRELGLWTGETLGAWFEARATQFSDQVAVIDGARSVTYRELLALVRRAAGGLRRAGLDEQDRVILQLPSSLELVQTLLALGWMGAIPVLALPGHRRLELTQFATRARAKGLIIAARHGGSDLLSVALEVQRAAPSLACLIAQGSATLKAPFVRLSSLHDHEEAPRATEPRGSDVALLQLSGGSTGVPKLIARTHDDYLYSVRESATLCGLSPATRFLAALPMTHNFALSSPGVLGVLDRGGTVIACPHPSPENVLRAFVDHGVTLVASVPALAQAWLEAKSQHLGDRTLPGLTLQVGGARLDASVARRLHRELGCKVQQVFGMAEGLVNYTRADDPEQIVCETQGRPLSPYDELRVVAPEAAHGEPVPEGETGELQTRGPYTIRGYFDDPAADARSFTPDGFYRTGDLVRVTPSGHLVVEGRLHDRILRGGEKIAPQEVEEQLHAHPAIADVAIVGRPDPVLGQKSHAFVLTRNSGQQLSLSDVRAFLRARGLAEFKLPDAVHVVTELPRTKVGKTDREALRDTPIVH
jgi:2,3-dihydroxybenzoate-AMP ligase